MIANILTAIKNVKAHPWTTISGAVGLVLIELTSTHDLKHALIAIGVLLLGALAKDPNAKS